VNQQAISDELRETLSISLRVKKVKTHFKAGI
jgi:hypothetical protein